LIIDELHMLGDESRGYLIELLLSKLVCLGVSGLQVIAMSATFPNLKEVSMWLGAALYLTNFRPVEVKEFVKFGSEVLDTKFESVRRLPFNQWDTKLGILSLVSETLTENGQLLIFCSSKFACEQGALTYANKLSIPMDSLETLAKLEEFKELVSDGVYRLLINGLAFHHSGLSLEEREVVEDLFKLKIVKVIFCTSTLAAGVNLPASRVIITSLKQGLSSTINSITYKQMVGRAGRYGLDEKADSYLVISNKKEKELAQVFMAEQLEAV